jgi:serine/threonine protein phosphatase 1
MSAFHLRVPPNRSGRDFVIGDLHGHRPALERALAECHFTAERDRLFSVGDLVDRGPDSPGAAALIREPWFHAVRGNHEDMLLRVLGGELRMIEVWRYNGGDWALDGWTVNAAGRTAGALCARLPLAITLEHRSGRRFGICHAQSPVTDWAQLDALAGDAQAEHEMLWGRERIRRDDAPAVRGVDWTIHGHTVVAAPKRSANALFIETGIFLPGGRLTLLCLDEV